MANIPIRGKLVNETVEGIIVDAHQVNHVNRNKDVATLIDELMGKVEIMVSSGSIPAKVRVIKDENIIEFEDSEGNIERLLIPIFINGSDFNDDFSDDFYNKSNSIINLDIYQSKYDPRINEDDKTVVGAINALSKKIGDIPEPARQKFRGEITLQNLLKITDAPDGDAYAVYAGYNDDDGTLSMQNYDYSGQKTAGTVFERANGAWIVPEVQPDFTGVVKMNVRPEKISVIKSLYAETSYKNLYGDSKAGMHIATVEDFVLDENGIYQKTFYDKGTPGQRYYSKTSEQKIVIPYARSYAQGANGDIVYTGGLLTDEDYRKLKEIDKDVFVATYGTTSFNKLVKAYEDGKMIIVKYGSHNIYTLEYYYGNEFRFSKVDIRDERADAVVSCISMSYENGWSSIIYNKTLENRGNCVSSTELKPSLITDIKYLTALAVKTLIEEYIANLANVASSGDYNDLINKPAIPSAVTDAVKYSAQSLTDAQQTQARQNIDAAEANHTHSGYANTSLSNIANAGSNIVAQINGNNVSILIDKLSVLPSAQYLADSDYIAVKKGSDNWQKIDLSRFCNYFGATIADGIFEPNASYAVPFQKSGGLLGSMLTVKNTALYFTEAYGVKSPVATLTGNYSVAFGAGSNSGDYSVVAGYGNNCTETYSSVFGYNNSATGRTCSFIGGGNNNSISGTFGSKAIIGGENNSVTGSAGGVFVGHHNSVTGQNAAVIAGHHNVADNSNCVAMGEYSLGLADSRAQHAGYGSRLLLLKIGNGTSNANSNAFEVWDNGRAFLGGEFVARRSFIVLKYDDYGWSVVNHSGNIDVQRNLARTTVLLTLTNIANTQEAYENFMISHELNVQYTYYAPIDGVYVFQKYTGANVLTRVRVINTGTYGIELTRNASIFKDLHPSEYISISFDCLY